MNKTAYLLAIVDLKTHAITGYGIYSEKTPTSLSNYVHHIVGEFHGDDFGEACDEARDHLRHGMKIPGVFGDYYRRIAESCARDLLDADTTEGA